MATTLNIVDLHQEDQLSSSKMTTIAGGRDTARERAVLEAILLAKHIDTVLNEPDPAPGKTSMKLPG